MLQGVNPKSVERIVITLAFPSFYLRESVMDLVHSLMSHMDMIIYVDV